MELIFNWAILALGQSCELGYIPTSGLEVPKTQPCFDLHVPGANSAFMAQPISHLPSAPEWQRTGPGEWRPCCTLGSPRPSQTTMHALNPSIICPHSRPSLHLPGIQRKEEEAAAAPGYASDAGWGQ